MAPVEANAAETSDITSRRQALLLCAAVCCTTAPSFSACLVSLTDAGVDVEVLHSRHACEDAHERDDGQAPLPQRRERQSVVELTEGRISGVQTIERTATEQDAALHPQVATQRPLLQTSDGTEAVLHCGGGGHDDSRQWIGDPTQQII
jgi:hypothetical protein